MTYVSYLNCNCSGCLRKSLIYSTIRKTFSEWIEHKNSLSCKPTILFYDIAGLNVLLKSRVGVLWND